MRTHEVYTVIARHDDKYGKVYDIINAATGKPETYNGYMRRAFALEMCRKLNRGELQKLYPYA